ncbi:hypothetical protein AOLI_G00147270 [Acnodon oligacanthus]
MGLACFSSCLERDGEFTRRPLVPILREVACQAHSQLVSDSNGAASTFSDSVNRFCFGLHHQLLEALIYDGMHIVAEEQ